MAENKSNATSRRGFLVGCGAVAAGAAVTGAIVQTALPWGVERPAGMTWGEAAGAALAALREAYRAEVERFATSLRPRFESGELRMITDKDLEDGEFGGKSPMYALEALCAEHFGLLVTRTPCEEVGELFEGSTGAAHLVLLASPHADLTANEGWNHVAYWANTAAGWDVLTFARIKGWSVPLEDEGLAPSFDADQAAQAARAAGTWAPTWPVLA